MTQEELLSEKIFIDLFNKNHFERIKEENKLFLEAKKLGIEKQFNKTLKQYEKLLSEKISIIDNINLPKCNYDIENYDMGKYICTINGIVDSKTD